MSFHLDMPQMPAGNDDVGQLYRDMFRMTEQLNYALSFLDLPGLTPSAPADQPADSVVSIGSKSTHAQKPSARAVYEYAVPQTREINGHALNADVTLDADDVGAVGETAMQAAIGEAIAESEERYADYVVETGGSGEWKWAKWNSGAVDIWGTGVKVTLGTAATWMTGLVYQNGEVAYPITLVNGDTAHVQTTTVNPTGETEINGILLVAIKQASGFQIRFVRKAAAAQVWLDVYVRGKWK